MPDETIRTVRYYWDDQTGVDPGWYVETWNTDGRVDDSQKVWFPVAVEDYSREDRAALHAALLEQYPYAAISGTP